MSDDTKGRLNRWSRLKQQSKTKPERGGAAPIAEAAAETDIEVAALTEDGMPEGAEQAVEPVIDLPPVESLGKDSDYTPFLQEGVPEELAKAAMRKLWKSDPIFGFRDGLDDYDEDFTIIQTIAEAMTARLGEGKKKKTAEKETDEKTVEAEATEQTENGETPQTEETASGETLQTDGTASGETPQTEETDGTEEKTSQATNAMADVPAPEKMPDATPKSS